MNTQEVAAAFRDLTRDIQWCHVIFELSVSDVNEKTIVMEKIHSQYGLGYVSHVKTSGEGSSKTQVQGQSL